jgi:hypothetical protein
MAALVAVGSEVDAEGRRQGCGLCSSRVARRPGAVGVGGGAGVGTQVIANVPGDSAGLGEECQGATERRGLGARGDPDGRAAGGDVVDEATADISSEQAWVLLDKYG